MIINYTVTSRPSLGPHQPDISPSDETEHHCPPGYSGTIAPEGGRCDIESACGNGSVHLWSVCIKISYQRGPISSRGLSATGRFSGGGQSAAGGYQRPLKSAISGGP